MHAAWLRIQQGCAARKHSYRLADTPPLQLAMVCCHCQDAVAEEQCHYVCGGGTLQRRVASVDQESEMFDSLAVHIA